MRSILIVGATSAIAIACARLWAVPGTRFYLVARNEARLCQTAADLRARGADVGTFVFDAGRPEDQVRLVQAAAAALGTIDIALIAYGTLPDQAACEADVALARREFEINGAAIVSLLVLLANVFADQRRGTIAVLTSVAADRGRRKNYLYGAAKASVAVFCEGLRVRMLREGVHILDIRPGFIATPMTSSLQLPRLLVTECSVAARAIVRAIDHRENVVYVPWFWRWIMAGVRAIPTAIFNRLNF